MTEEASMGGQASGRLGGPRMMEALDAGEYYWEQAVELTDGARDQWFVNTLKCLLYFHFTDSTRETWGEFSIDGSIELPF